MNKTVATAALAAVLGLAATAPFVAASAADQEKCFGVAAKAHNDCAAGAHSCAGNSTMDRDPASFVVVPSGVCGKIAGGKLTPA